MSFLKYLEMKFIWINSIYHNVMDLSPLDVQVSLFMSKTKKYPDLKIGAAKK